jgi:LemA protein
VLIAIIVVVLLLVVYVISVYNGLKKLQVRIQASLQEIGNQLKRQLSLIPNLESTVKGSASHERGIYDSISSARAGVNSAMKKLSAGNLDAVENSMKGMISGMRVVVESNPELKANANFASLMEKLEDTADKIMYSRRLLIDLTAKYNEKLQIFPSNIVAGMFSFKPEKGLETPTEGEHVTVTEEETKGAKVNFESEPSKKE